MKKIVYTILTLTLILSLTSCADAETVGTCLKGHEYGFWGGLWHGIITPFSFIGSLIWDDITVYAVNNNGGWYDFGFVLGVGGLGFSGGKKS
jgi:hypothetical protein